MKNIFNRGTLATILMVTFVVAAAGFVYASIPDAQGVIHGCRNNLTGSLRVIDSATSNCRSGETALNWNQQGVAGARGISGYTARLNDFGKSPTEYASLIDSNQETTSRSGRDVLSPLVTLTAKSFSVKLTHSVTTSTSPEQPVAPGPGNSRTFNLLVNTNSYLLCTVADTATSCSVSNLNITIPPNSLIALSATNAGGLGTVNMNALYSLEIN